LSWIVPALVVSRSGEWEPRAVVLVSLVVGLGWQVAYRRDLADRLAFLAEQGLRVRDDRHALRAARARGSVPTGP
jgi:hypothetical protein